MPGTLAARDGPGDPADRAGGGMLQRRPRSRAAHPRAADTGRPADCCDRARLRGCQRPRRVTLRSGAGVVRRQPRGQAQGLCAAGGQEHDEPAGTCPRRRMLPLSQDRLRSRGAAGRVRRRVPRCARQGAAGERARPRCHPLHGHQEGRFFHGYYDCYCYLPLYVFCGRQLLAAKLRRSKIDAAARAKDEMARLVARIRRRWPKVRILLRADSGFAREELMAWCEDSRVDYLFGLARNSRLLDEIAIDLAWAEAEHQETGKPARRFKDFFYATRDSWNRRRRVIGKAEHLAKGANPRFIVTSLIRQAIDAQTLYEQVYCARGEMENRIKECQLDLWADRTSTATMAANQLRLWFSSVAHVLLEALRRIGLPHTELAQATCGTIRLKLLKLGARVTVSVRRIKIAIASACPHHAEFALAHARLRAPPG